MIDGAVDTGHVHSHGKHSHGCCIKCGVDVVMYDYEGKAEEPCDVLDTDEMENDQNAMVLGHEPVAKKQARRAIDCQEEMKTRIVDLVNSQHSLPPKTPKGDGLEIS